ncbi:MAG: folate-binding protein [Gemmobacter sp.]|jgi:folate-binding protein YgfZ|nr:folate-binding protein [Gemmobacter sp.]
MRRLVTLTGADRLDFLQGLVTNDVLRLTARGIVYAALLTPQGKYLADFFVVNTGAELLLDLPESLADATLRRLAMYRLRADVQLTPSALMVSLGLGAAPEGALPDPRHLALGWRRYGPVCETDPGDRDALRVEYLIPETLIELLPDETFILEAGFERLNGVDFGKGCYVGQEVTARMKHKTELRKGLVRLRISGEAPVGTAILTADGREAGTLYTRSGDRALAQMRFERMRGALSAGSAQLEAE